MKNFRMTKLAAAIGAATMSLALAPSANAVVVVGGDNGWEVSFDGNVNAFYSHISQDDLKTTTTTAGGASATTTTSAGVDASRIHSGFLPAFFSFNVKSPAVNGLTGTGQTVNGRALHVEAEECRQEAGMDTGGIHTRRGRGGGGSATGCRGGGFQIILADMAVESVDVAVEAYFPAVVAADDDYGIGRRSQRQTHRRCANGGSQLSHAKIFHCFLLNGSLS